ncbi:hypothetical protein [Haloarchaeobius sp. HRN-SO-5]|uniref:hypothetical protein n=1 Tax=Haloarchaeobius sp. HRN-SO-5 TaxID=3446118 RepID=UPI003EB804E5
MTPSSATRPPDADHGRRKATLFCSVCDHESPTDGDWVLADATAGTAYECPECGHTVTVRRSYADGDDEAGSGRPTARLVSTPVKLWADYVEVVNRAASRWAPGD